MRKFFYHNSLSIVFFLLFLITVTGQVVMGYTHNNELRKEEGQAALSYQQYIHSGHFIQSTFENWESEFLQMALFVLFTIWLRQKGSSESKSCDGHEEVDRKLILPVIMPPGL